MATIERHRCTMIGAVATLYLMMVQHPRAYDLGSLRVAMSGGRADPAELLAAFPRRFGVPLIEGYGITEIGGTVSQPPLGGEARAGAVGVPVQYVEVAVLDDADRPLPAGEVGELRLRGPTVMRGYYGQPAATAETLRHGWLHTGDVGYRDAEGYCYIVDRKKDVIITSGFNVYPREVEDVLYQHAAVAEAGRGRAAAPAEGRASARLRGPAPGDSGHSGRADRLLQGAPDALQGAGRSSLLPHAPQRTIREDAPPRAARAARRGRVVELQRGGGLGDTPHPPSGEARRRGGLGHASSPFWRSQEKGRIGGTPPIPRSDEVRAAGFCQHLAIHRRRMTREEKRTDAQE